MKTLLRCAALAFLAVAAAAWSDDAVRLVTSVDKVERASNARGEPERRLVAAERVTRGDELQYSITFINQSDETVDAGSIVITNPIPDNTIYVDDSAYGAGTDIVFSADAGESWGAPGLLTTSSGGGAAPRADAADYTHIRWTYQSPLEPGQQGSVSFRVILQ